MLAVVSAGMGGCAGDELDPAQAAEAEVEPLRLGRVHVLLEPDADAALDLEGEYVDPLEITARFAFVRGLDEDFVRVNIDMPVLPTEVLAPPGCVASDTLTAVDTLGAPSADIPELHLVDAGELRMQIGDDSEGAFEVPVSLMPDLLPYMTGFEYRYYGEQVPSSVSDGTTTAVVVEARGSQTEELPAFRAEGVVPPALRPHVVESDLRELGRGEALVFHWAGGQADGDDLVTLRLTGLAGNEPVGSELTCVVADAGQTRLSLESLRTLGLSLDADALRITMSRLQATQFDAGDFVGSELFVERRERLVLPLR
ncbi:MAG: hypothetical protein KDK70_29245 [Myxococcales bacterium]|nr:hypothetical protein [Myxococcales bacterium]